MGQCQEIRNYWEIPENSFCIIYGIVGNCSLILNGFIIYMHYKYERKILGKRATFNLIMKLQNIFDFLMSILLIIHSSLYIVHKYQDLIYMYIFDEIRNILYGLDILILTLMAFDRFMAVSYPTSIKWNAKKIKIIFGCFSIFLTVLDVLVTVLWKSDIQCDAKAKLRMFYLWSYGMACFLMLITNICSYLKLFIVFYFQTKKLTIEQRNQEERKRMAKLIKFGRFLFLINVVYIICLLPVTIVNTGIFAHVTFNAYHIFYFVVVVNPIVFIFGNQNVVAFIFDIFRKNKTSHSVIAT